MQLGVRAPGPLACTAAAWGLRVVRAPNETAPPAAGFPHRAAEARGAVGGTTAGNHSAPPGEPPWGWCPSGLNAPGKRRFGCAGPSAPEHRGHSARGADRESRLCGVAGGGPGR